MVTRRSRRAFPVGLYATLLVALCCVAAPRLPRSAQGWLQSLLCLPLSPWMSAESEGVQAGVQGRAQPEVEAAVRELLRRLERSAVSGVGPLLPAGLEPVFCRVVDRVGRGAAGLPSTLYLDRDPAELAGCLEFVTFGDDLVGFIAPPPADDSGAPRFARVNMLHGVDEQGWSRPVPGVAEVQGGEVRFVVEPASHIDQWPLRCRLFEEPYRASRLRNSGAPVRTAALEDDPLGAVPAGLGLGSLQVWGYPGDVGGAQIGLFVRPELDPRSLSVVVAWRPRRDVAAGGLKTSPVAASHDVSRLRLPGASQATQRWLLGVERGRRLPPGAAVSAGHMVFGVVEQSGPGFAMASTFGRSRRLWSLLFLPDSRELDPVPLLARSVGGADGGSVRVRIEGDAAVSASGILFTGANGPHCPLGMMVGRSERATLDGRELLVEFAPGRAGPLAVRVGQEVTLP